MTIAVALFMTNGIAMKAQTTNLDSLTIMLGDVVVKGHKPVYKLSEEGLKTNVQGTVLEKLGSAKEVLGHVPGVQKRKDAIEVTGKGTPLIYINGRQMRDDNELESLRADEIKSVELITTPGAKYGADVRSVIKIRTIRKKGEGLGGDFRSSYYQSENADFMENVNLTYRRKAWDVFGTASYSSINTRYITEMSTTLKADNEWENILHQKALSNKQSLKGMIGTAYAINDSNSVGMRYSYLSTPRSVGRFAFTNDVFKDNEPYDKTLTMANESTNHSPYHYVNAYYKGMLGKLDIDLNADFVHSESKDLTEYTEESENYESRQLSTQGKVKNNMFATKLIASYPLFKGKLSVGAEYTQTRRNDDFLNPEKYIVSSRAKLEEEHIAPFVEYSKSTAIGNVNVGVRYERVKFDYYENDVHQDEQSRSFGNLFPSISLLNKIGNVQMLLSYAAKTRRPSYRQLSNNVTYINRFQYDSGNPYLKHEYIHDVSLMGMWKFIELSLTYNDRRDGIVYWEKQGEDPTVACFSFANMHSIKNVGASLNVSPTIGIWSPELSVSVARYWLHFDVRGVDKNFKTPIWQTYFNNTFDFGKGWLATANVWLVTKGYKENIENTRFKSSYDVMVKKSFMNDQLSIAVGCSDMFHSEKSGDKIYRTNVITHQKAYYDSREVFLTLRYKFNTMRSKYKGSGAGNEERNRF